MQTIQSMCHLNVYVFCAEYLVLDSQLMCSFPKKAISPTLINPQSPVVLCLK